MKTVSTWKTVVRWLIFIPAGLIGIILFRLGVLLAMWGNPEGQWWHSAFASSSEPWGFLLIISLWIIPRFHRNLIIIFSTSYILLYSGELLYFLSCISSRRSTYEIWTHTVISLSGIVSAAVAMIYFYRKYKREEISISNIAIDV
jgi:hypothetical protein